MYESLARHCPDFHLYIFPFDDRTHRVLQSLALPHTTLVTMREFEDEDLLRVKPGRTIPEYCWTAKPPMVLYVLKRFNVPHCTYVDADLYFYHDPSILTKEMGDDSVLLTPHRFTPENDISVFTGRNCAQYMTFTQGPDAAAALHWWRDACLDWCFDRAEPGRYGDQRYIDDWAERFRGVHLLHHLGGGLGPWNVQQYRFSREGGKLKGTELSTGKQFDVVFYHFHYIRFYQNGKIDIGDYRLPPNVRDMLYRPYLAELEAAKVRIAALDSSFDPHGPRAFPTHWKWPLILFKRRLRRRYNIYPASEFMPATGE